MIFESNCCDFQDVDPLLLASWNRSVLPYLGHPKSLAEFQWVPVLVAHIGWLHRRDLIQSQLKVPQLPLQAGPRSDV